MGSNLWVVTGVMLATFIHEVHGSRMSYMPSYLRSYVIANMSISPVLFKNSFWHIFQLIDCTSSLRWSIQSSVLAFFLAPWECSNKSSWFLLWIISAITFSRPKKYKNLRFLGEISISGKMWWYFTRSTRRQRRVKKSYMAEFSYSSRVCNRMEMEMVERAGEFITVSLIIPIWSDFQTTDQQEAIPRK